MLEQITKEQFIEGVQSGRFIVVQKAVNKTIVSLVEFEGERVHIKPMFNPDSKDGSFKVDSNALDKGFETMEQVAMYIDKRDGDNTRSCVMYLIQNPNFNAI